MGMAAEPSLSYAAIESGCWATYHDTVNSEQVYLLSSIVCVLFCLAKPFFSFLFTITPNCLRPMDAPPRVWFCWFLPIKMEFLPTAIALPMLTSQGGPLWSFLSNIVKSSP